MNALKNGIPKKYKVSIPHKTKGVIDLPFYSAVEATEYCESHPFTKIFALDDAFGEYYQINFNELKDAYYHEYLYRKDDPEWVARVTNLLPAICTYFIENYCHAHIVSIEGLTRYNVVIGQTEMTLKIMFEKDYIRAEDLSGLYRVSKLASAVISNMIDGLTDIKEVFNEKVF